MKTTTFTILLLGFVSCGTTDTTKDTTETEKEYHAVQDGTRTKDTTIDPMTVITHPKY